MYTLLRFLTLLALTSLLSSCAYVESSDTFRNRTFDYTHQDVQNNPPLQTPSNLATPQFSPNFVIPPGQEVYPAGNPPNMQPPGFNDVVPIPPPPPKTSHS